ncbi:GL11949 [Drosophila persimilis]|uniref:GL11949 n=1 Tax=Drosophila persimilis TaxID=7234 RepID=B4GLY8_DROPE|nr:GL11949 [Drosophila persimilis]
MPYAPANSYEGDLKIWSGSEIEEYFAPDLSIGEIIFHEMRRHPKLIAQGVEDYVRERTDSTYKHLHEGAIIVEDLIRSPNGKTNRKSTKDYFLEVKERQ